jgi:hypothetical protein
MINFLKAKREKGGKLVVLFLIIMNLGCPPPMFELTFDTPNENFQTIQKQKFGKALSYLLYNNDSLYFKIEGEITRYGKNDFRIHKSIYLGIYFKSKYNLVFRGDSICIIDSANLKIYPDAHSIFHKNNYYKKIKNHELGIVFHSNKEDLSIPVYLYLPDLKLMENDTIITKLKFPKIEMTPIIDKIKSS